jgi:hypothetical protein
MSNSKVYGFDDENWIVGMQLCGIAMNDATLNLGANNIIGDYESGSGNAIGIDMYSDISSSTVNIQGKNNTIYGENTAGGNAYGIYIGEENTGTINISSEHNTIYGEASGDGENNSDSSQAAGIYGELGNSIATINITGNNNTIYGSNSIYNNFENAVGIHLRGSSGTVNILSDDNTIYGEIEESDSDYGSYATGIDLKANNNTLNISGDKNIIYGNNFDGYEAEGIYVNSFGGQSNINIASDGNVISASQSNNVLSSPFYPISGIYSDGNLTITGSNNTVNASSNTVNDVSGIDYEGNGTLLIANTTINVTNDNTDNENTAIGVLIGKDFFTTSQPTSVTLNNNTINVSNASTASGSESSGIEIGPSNTNSFTIEDNVFKVTGGEVSYGIFSVDPLGSKKSNWIKYNTFSGDITDANKVVD